MILASSWPTGPLYRVCLSELIETRMSDMSSEIASLGKKVFVTFPITICTAGQ